MVTSIKYDQLVEGFRAKISGNISSEKMTPEETAKEIAEVTEGVFAEREEGNKGSVDIIVPILPTTKPQVFNQNGIEPLTVTIPGGYTTKSGRHYKSKPGRKPKVK